jgi:hypothetical protein
MAIESCIAALRSSRSHPNTQQLRMYTQNLNHATYLQPSCTKRLTIDSEEGKFVHMKSQAGKGWGMQPPRAKITKDYRRIAFRTVISCVNVVPDLCDSCAFLVGARGEVLVDPSLAAQSAPVGETRSLSYNKPQL